MGTPPTDPSQSDQLDEETKQIIEERLKTVDEDGQAARPAKEVLAELGVKLKRKPPDHR